jgi:hypothetical protein
MLAEKFMLMLETLRTAAMRWFSGVTKKITGRANIKPGLATIKQRTTMKIWGLYLPYKLYAFATAIV